MHDIYNVGALANKSTIWHVCVWMCVHAYVHNIYIYMCVYIYIYTYVYIYIYIQIAMLTHSNNNDTHVYG